jgi:hypothetical protein
LLLGGSVNKTATRAIVVDRPLLPGSPVSSALSEGFNL